MPVVGDTAQISPSIIWPIPASSSSSLGSTSTSSADCSKSALCSDGPEIVVTGGVGEIVAAVRAKVRANCTNRKPDCPKNCQNGLRNPCSVLPDPAYPNDADGVHCRNVGQTPTQWECSTSTCGVGSRRCSEKTSTTTAVTTRAVPSQANRQNSPGWRGVPTAPSAARWSIFGGGGGQLLGPIGFSCTGPVLCAPKFWEMILIPTCN